MHPTLERGDLVCFPLSVEEGEGLTSQNTGIYYSI